MRGLRLSHFLNRTRKGMIVLTLKNKSMKTLTQTPHKYRTMRTDFINFHCEVDNLVIESYTKFNGKSRLGALDIFLFDSITWTATRGEWIQAIGWNGKELCQLVMKRKNI